MAAVAKLDDYLAQVRGLSEAAFAAEHPYPFLLLVLPEQEQESDWSFKTTTITTDAMREAVGLAPAAGLASTANRYRVFQVAKSAQNPWSDRVSVGRARNNDIVLPHRSVSKLHAHFSRSGEQITLTDARSHNGVRVNQDQIAPMVATTVKPGDQLTFGAVVLTMVDAAGLYQLIQKNLRG